MSEPYEIRPAGPADYEFFVRLFPDLETPDDPPSRERYEQGPMVDSFVLRAGGADSGLANSQTLDGIGYVRQIIVAREARGRGLGRALMHECMRRFLGAGCTRFCLNVKPDNATAIRLYESLGLRRSHACTAIRLRWEQVAGIGAAQGHVVEPTAQQIRAGEQRFGIPAGQVAQQASKGQWVVRAVLEGEQVVGLASFDPGFPGCSPFRASGPGVMRALLEGLRGAARPEEPGLQLVLEDATELAAALEAAGASRTLDFLHFAGPLDAAAIE